MSYGPWDCKILKQTHITEGKHGVAITCNITIKKIKRPWQMSLQGTCVRNMHASSCAAIMYQQIPWRNMKLLEFTLHDMEIHKKCGHRLTIDIKREIANSCIRQLQITDYAMCLCTCACPCVRSNIDLYKNTYKNTTMLMYHSCILRHMCLHQESCTRLVQKHLDAAAFSSCQILCSDYWKLTCRSDLYCSSCTCTLFWSRLLDS